MARILVTGAAGYIGSVLVPILLQKGHQVVALDNFHYRQSALLDCCHQKGLELVRGDARNQLLIERLTQRVDFIFPLACIVGAPACANDPTAARTINLEAIKMLTYWCGVNHRGQGVIFPNTNSGYGFGQKDVYCDENSPLKPVSLYARLKVEAEEFVLKHGNAISLRLATVFGISPRMRTDLLVNDLVQMAVNDYAVKIYEPHAKRNYIHVRDVARAFLHCLENFDRMSGQVYNVGLSDANLSKWELCAEIKKQIPAFTFLEGEGKDPDQRDYLISNAKIEAAGFKPEVSLAEGIAELIKGYQIIKNNQFRNI